MAAATAITSRRGNDQFRGVFNDTFAVTCTLNTASIADQATGTDTVAVPGVILGDMVLMSTGVDEAGLVRRAYVSAAGTVTIASTNTTGGAVDLASTTVRLVIVRMV
jgi:hypothetical protein